MCSLVTILTKVLCSHNNHNKRVKVCGKLSRPMYIEHKYNIIKMEPPKKRRPRFSKEELEVLCEEVGENKLLLFGKFSDNVSLQRKKKCWSTITSRVNAVSVVTRSVDEIRRKWLDWSSSIKIKGAKKSKALNKTGGGNDEIPDLSVVEEKVLGILGKAAVDGISGGLDTVTMKKKESVDDSPHEDKTQSTFENKPINQSDSESSTPEFMDPCCSKTSPVLPESETSKRISSENTPPVTESKRQKFSKVNVESDILEIEKARLEIEEARLDVEQSRLDIETSRAQKEDRIIELLEQLVSTKRPYSHSQDDMSYYTSL